MPLRFRILAAAPDATATPATPDIGPAVERLVDVSDDVAEIRFGRREGLEIVLPFPALSGLHARLVRANGGGFWLEDLGSRNGTARADRELPPHGRAPLRPGERFRLANVWIVFEGAAPATGPGKSGAAVEGTGTLARRLVRDLLAGRADGGAVARLTVASGPEAGRVLRLERPDHEYTVGRDPSCDLALAAGDLSRAHAGLTRRWEGAFVRDLGSKNGVNVGEEPVEGERRLRDGDRLRLGAVAFSFEDPEDRYLRQLELASPGPPPPVPPPSSKPAARSSVNLSHPDLSRIPSPQEIAPADAALPSTRAARAVLAVAAMVLFAAIALLVFFFFLP